MSYRWLEPDGKTVKAQGQYHGRIVAADKDKGFKIECEGVWAGKTMGLPPHLQSFRPANPGKYELRSTGEVVNDPDGSALNLDRDRALQIMTSVSWPNQKLRSGTRAAEQCEES